MTLTPLLAQDSSSGGFADLFGSSSVTGVVVALVVIVGVAALNLANLRQVPAEKLAVSTKWRGHLVGIVIAASFVILGGIWLAEWNWKQHSRHQPKYALESRLRSVAKQPIPKKFDKALVILEDGRVRMEKNGEIRVFLSSRPHSSREIATRDLVAVATPIVLDDFRVRYGTTAEWNIDSKSVLKHYLTPLETEELKINFGGSLKEQPMYRAHGELVLTSDAAKKLYPEFQAAARGRRAQAFFSAAIGLCGLIVCVALLLVKLNSNRGRGTIKWTAAYVFACAGVLAAAMATMPNRVHRSRPAYSRINVTVVKKAQPARAISTHERPSRNDAH